MPTQKDLATLPTADVVKLAHRARTALKKNATKSEATRDVAIQIGSTLLGGTVVGAIEGSSDEEPEEIVDGLSAMGTYVSVGGILGGLAVSAFIKGDMAQMSGKFLAGLGSGAGAYTLGNFAREKLEASGDSEGLDSEF